MSKINLTQPLPAGTYALAEGQITLDADAEAGGYTLADFVPLLTPQFTVTVAEGYVVTVHDTSEGTVPTDEMVIAWSDGKPTECPVGGSVSHTYPNASQRMIVQTFTRADGTTATYRRPVYPNKITPPAGNPPVSPPPPPVTPPPPVAPPPSQTSPGTPPKSSGAQPNATHTVAISVVDADGKTWAALANVCEDWTVDGVYVSLADMAGNPHPSLRALAYADCVDVGAANGRDGNDYAGALTVAYDGAEVANVSGAQFYHGTLNQTIRYGKQAPWHAVDASLFPNWATPTAPLPLADLTKYDLSYNGMGVATMQGMGSTGSRPDIAYVPAWDVPFCVQPSDAAYAVVRAAADHSGAWPIYFLDDDTGLPFDIGTYPMTSFLPYKQATYAGNPIAAYSNPAKITGSLLAWDEAHETGYNFVAAAASGTARDKFHAAAWANAMLTAFNPQYRQQTFTWNHYQERGSAWALRSVFLASYLSAMPEYFTAQLATMLATVPATNPLGFLADYMRPGANDVPNGSSTGIAIWQENYLRIVVNVVAYKRPEWQSFAAYLGANVTTMLADARYPLSTLYVHTIKDSQGNFLPTWTAVLQATLTGPQGIGTQGAWPAADIAAATDPAITPQALDALIRKNMPGYASNKLGDFVQYASAPDAYPALMRAAIAGLVDLNVPGAAAAWQVCEAVPTKPDCSSNWAFNIVPRAA